MVTGLQAQGTETDCPFTPKFQSIVAAGDDVRALLRGWHGESVVVEATSHIQDWSPIYTNTLALPGLEYRDTNRHGEPQQFYRAVRQ